MRTYLPNWNTKVEEVSNGVFKVTLTDQLGRKVETSDAATDETIEKAIADAFEIEKQATKNWNKFLYDLCLLLFLDNEITFKEYNDRAFGSWFIEISGNKRLVYNGRDYWLITQVKSGKNWNDQESIDNSDLTYPQLLRIIADLKS